MLSLSNMKNGAIVPSEEDRKKILTQMKVKTTLRSDMSWIQKRSDSEEEKNHTPLKGAEPLKRTTSERSPVSSKVSPLNHRAVFEELASQAEQHSPETNKPSKNTSLPRSPAGYKMSTEEYKKLSHNATSPTGYLIRGVFTKTVDKGAPSDPVSNGSPKSTSLPRSPSGYKMSTEEYKKLAPYNVKRDTVPAHVAPPVSPDEQLKRTEAASSVLRQTARKERSYVLSAAKKSHGSAAQEAPSFMAKRVEIEEDTGPRSRSQTMPASSWTTSHGKSTNGERRSTLGSPWSDQKMSNAASTNSIDTCSKNPAPKHYPNYSSAFNHFSSLENSKKPDQGKSRDDSTPKVSDSPPKRSEKNGGKFWPPSGSEKRDAIFSEDSEEARKLQSAKVRQTSQVPHISPEASPKRSSSRYRTGDADTAAEIQHRSETGEYLNGSGADSARYAADHKEENLSRETKYGSPSSRVTEDQPATAKDSADSLSGERDSEPTLVSTNQDLEPKSLEEKTTQEEANENPCETECKKEETPPANSSSLSMENGTAAPEGQQGEPVSDSDTSRGATCGSSGSSYRMPTDLDHLVYNRTVLESGRRTSPYLDRQTSYAGRTTCGMPSYLNSQPYHTNNLEMTHRMTSYPNNPAFNSGRSFSTSRESLMASAVRSHRMPFYKDVCDTDSRRYLTGLEERAAFTSGISPTSSQLRSPCTSGYDSDPATTSKPFLLVKESINSTEMSSSPRCNSRSLVDLSTLERANYSGGNYMQSSPPRRPFDDICTFCGHEIRNCPKIKIEKLNICCHEFCFRCGICHKPMGDMLDKVFIHRDIVHCDKCYEKLF